MTTCDILVAGLGVMGSAVADHAARLGARVVGLDRFQVPHDRGSSHGETRNIRQAIYERSWYVPLLQRAFTLWEELERDSGRSLLRLTGRIMIGRSDGAAIRGAMTTAAEHHLPIEVLSAAEIRERYPIFEPDDDMVGVYEERAGMLLAERCVEAQLARARRRGAELRFGEVLIDWQVETDRTVRVRTDRGEYSTRRLVLALGAWLPTMVPSLPLEIERQVLLWFEPIARRTEWSPDRCPIYLWELSPDFAMYGVPLWGDGIKVARHHGGERCTVDSVRRSVDQADIDQVRKPLERYMPSAAGALLLGRTCLYTNTPDRDFIVDCHPDTEAVLVVSPCSGHGFKYAPAIGEAVAALASSTPPEVDLTPFRSNRFQQ